MMYLMAQRAKKPTYFYHMALATSDLLPPPETVQVEIGERRVTKKRSSIKMAVGNEIDMDNFPGSDNPDKHVRRKCRADYIRNLVKQDYNLLTR